MKQLTFFIFLIVGTLFSSCSAQNEDPPAQEEKSINTDELFTSLTKMIEADKLKRSKTDSIIDKIPAISIGNQRWAKYNLDVITFQNGEKIHQATSMEDWKICCDSAIPAWCYMSDNKNYNTAFGKLYNAAALSDPRKILPEGWRIPTPEEWTQLTNSMENPICALKSTVGWWDKSVVNCRETKQRSEFCAYPAGMRNAPGMFGAPFEHAYFWSLRENFVAEAFNLTDQIADIATVYTIKYAGMSVRAIHE